MSYINGIHRIIIFSSNSDELGKFYKNVFRFPLLYHYFKDKRYILNAGNCEIEIRNVKECVASKGIVFKVDDINSAYNHYKSIGVNVSEISETGNESQFDLIDVQGNEYVIYRYDDSGRF